MAFAALRWPPPVSEISSRTRLVAVPRSYSLRTLRRAHHAQCANAFEPLQCGTPAPLHGATVGEQRSCRRIVETKDIAELDVRVAMVPVMVFRQDDLQGAKRFDDERRAHPTEIGRVAPPYVQLSEHESENRAGGGPTAEKTARVCESGIPDGTEKSGAPNNPSSITAGSFESTA